MVPAKLDVKGTQILAKTLFKELRGSGYTPNQILGLSTELIDLVTKDLKAGPGAAPRGRRRDAEARAGGRRSRAPRPTDSAARSTEKRTAPTRAPFSFLGPAKRRSRR